MSVNRRKFARFQISRTQCRAEFQERDHEVFQVDMSIDGIGIIGSEVDSLDYGEAIKVAFDDESIEGICCSARRLDDGTLHIGVQRGAQPKSKGTLLKKFIDCGECEVACDVVSCDGDKATVRLIDGRSFVMPSSRIKSRTQNERAVELRDEKQLSLLSDFYQIDKKKTVAAKDNRDLVEAVVAFEFGLGFGAISHIESISAESPTPNDRDWLS